jgi:hypothetical protein
VAVVTGLCFKAFQTFLPFNSIVAMIVEAIISFHLACLFTFGVVFGRDILLIPSYKLKAVP